MNISSDGRASNLITKPIWSSKASSFAKQISNANTSFESQHEHPTYVFIIIKIYTKQILDKEYQQIVLPLLFHFVGVFPESPLSAHNGLEQRSLQKIVSILKVVTYIVPM